MSLEITGKLINKLDLVTGQGKNGEWKKQSFVILTAGDYPKSICFQLWGDKCALLDKANLSDILTVSFEAESREYNGNYYTDLKCWKFQIKSKGGAQVAKPVPPKKDGEEEDDGLPF